jgi:DNA mismatch repair protein MutH
MKEDIQKLLDELNVNKPIDLNSRGRGCIGKGMLAKALKAKKGAKSEREIVDNLAKEIEYVKIEGKSVYMEYPRCFCHHVKNIKDKIPESYCKCSEGWVEKLFETALGRSVKAEVEQSVIRGASKCKIKVYV